MIKYLVFDTETTGLNIVKDTPFLFQYGLVDEDLNLVNAICFYEDDKKELDKFIHHLKTIKTYIGHNIKFDLHMLINAGIDSSIFNDKNFIDTSVLARLVLSHDVQTEGSFSASLKKLATRYLGINSADEERILKVELSSLKSAHKLKLKDYLISNGVWTWSNSNNTTQTKILNEIYNTWNKHYHKYSDELKQVRNKFYELYPEPNYKDVSNVKTYGLTDIKLTHGLFKLWYKDVVRLQQTDTLVRVSKATLPLLFMERKGMSIDLNRIIKDRNEILKELQRVKLIDPRTGKELSVGQHAKLKEVYEYESGLLLSSSDKKARASLAGKSPTADKANYLSKLSKYLNTYITGILNKLTDVNNEYKVYTQYNLAGTITGRLSSDFQQFPKEPLVLDTGHEVNIRSWFVVPKGDKYMFYFDYSQLELRLQCEWTNIVNGHPDINMARAFGPYKCIKINDKYYLEEDHTIEWKPTDLHALTAKHAFPNAKETDPDWSHFRALGKRTNFAVNYGAAAPKIQEALDVDFATAQALVNGYKKAFAGVVDFGKWISRRVYVTNNIPNLFLRRYYSRNKHQLQNWLVQGSGADLLLIKLAEAYEYLKNKPHWNFLITVHDEIGFTCKDIPETQLRKEISEIKQLMSYSLSAVDVISDVEITTTNWAEKKDYV